MVGFVLYEGFQLQAQYVFSSPQYVSSSPHKPRHKRSFDAGSYNG